MAVGTIMKGYRSIDEESEFAANVCAYLNGSGGNILASAAIHVKELLSSIQTKNLFVYAVLRASHFLMDDY